MQQESEEDRKTDSWTRYGVEDSKGSQKRRESRTVVVVQWRTTAETGFLLSGRLRSPKNAAIRARMFRARHPTASSRVLLNASVRFGYTRVPNLWSRSPGAFAHIARGARAGGHGV